jgi:hypothetical protein
MRDEYNKIARQRTAGLSKNEANLQWFQEAREPMFQKVQGQQ